MCSLVLLDKCSDTSLSKSLACLAWQPTHGKVRGGEGEPSMWPKARGREV